MTTVRIAHAEPRPGDLGNGRFLILGFLVVLADDAGHRALPLWLRGEPSANSLRELLDRPPGDTTAAEAPEDLTARLLRAAGARVTGVDIDASGADTPGLFLDPATATTRIELTSHSVIRNAPSRLTLALALALAAGAPVRVADAVMDRLAVPVRGDDLLTPFLDLEPPPDPRFEAKLRRTGGRRPPAMALRIASRCIRFEPRNMAFADGLDRWDLDPGLLYDADQPSHLTDYQVTAGDGSAALSSAVPAPRDCAALVQTIYADDYRNTTVTFGADVRADPATQHAALRLEILRQGWIREPSAAEGHDVTIPVGRDWARCEAAVPVPEDADMIRFGVFLSGPGVIQLRNPDLGAPKTPPTRER
jgi:bifunctional DNase/RNase